MKAVVRIFFQSFVSSFYRKNAGAFVLAFTFMFFIVSTVDGAGLLAYHTSLVTAMLTLPAVLWLVFFLWLLYARKCAMYVFDVMSSPPFSFLQIVNSKSKKERFGWFFLVNGSLLLPLLLYALFIVWVGWQRRLFLPVVLVVVYLMLLCVVSSLWHVHKLSNVNQTEKNDITKSRRPMRFSASYPFILIRYVMKEHKAIWLAVKLFTCGILYLIVRNNSNEDYEVVVAFMFFNFGVYGNALLIYLVREWEETYLSFYRSLPVPLFKRFMNYVFVYGFVFLPEFITLLFLTPVHLHIIDATGFALCGYGVLLLINSLLYVADLTTKEYVVLLLCFFCFQFLMLITVGFVMMACLFLLISSVIFFLGYHRFEVKPQKEGEMR